MCFNTLSKPKARISTNPAGLADFPLYPLCCRLLQSSSIHPPFPLHTMRVSWDTDCPHQEDAATQTRSHTLPQAQPVPRAGTVAPSEHVMPGTALLLRCLVQGYRPPKP